MQNRGGNIRTHYITRQQHERLEGKEILEEEEKKKAVR